MYIILYIILISFVFRLFLTVFVSNPILGLVLIGGYIGYSMYRKKHLGLRGWRQGPYQTNTSNQSYTNSSTYSSGPSNSGKDVFEAEYTEHEVH